MKLQLLILSFLSMFYFSAFSQSIGLIGNATPGGWDTDTDMVQDGVNPDMWTLEVALLDSFAKFRQDDAWDINWGSSDFPTGVGTQGGPDIPVFAGDYLVTFNSATGEYNFAVESAIGILGDATSVGWDSDLNMYRNSQDPNEYFITLDLAVGPVKFRQDDAWDVNWGGTDFPSGTGVLGSNDNIPVDKAGTYTVTFNVLTLEYSFEEVITFSSIGIIGNATPGGWDTDTDLVQSASDPNVWSADMTLVDGEAKFRANDAWDVDWGSSDFPEGTGVQGGDNIPVTAGDYRVTLNTETGEYSFVTLVEYGTIGIIGDATPGVWDTDTDMEQDENDPYTWRLREILTDGELKFRAEDDWAYNWGSGDFPSGVGVQEGANIPIPAGEYKITFNTLTGAYNFEEIKVFGTVGIVGTATPLMSWDIDVDMTMDPNDEQLWKLSPVDLVDGELKFRAEDDWAVNWGSADFPTGTGIQEGDNILVVGGTYGVTLKADTGEYAFGSPDKTQNLLTPGSVSLYPNPTSTVVNLDIQDDRLLGDLQIEIIDFSGKVVLKTSINTNTQKTVDVSNLMTGNYMMRITNGQNLVGKKLSIQK